MPARGLVEAADDIHQRRFARSGRAHHSDELARIDFERHAAQRVHLNFAEIVGFDDILEPDGGRVAGCLSRLDVGRNLSCRRALVHGGWPRVPCGWRVQQPQRPFR